MLGRLVLGGRLGGTRLRRHGLVGRAVVYTVLLRSSAAWWRGLLCLVNQAEAMVAGGIRVVVWELV